MITVNVGAVVCVGATSTVTVYVCSYITLYMKIKQNDIPSLILWRWSGLFMYVSSGARGWRCGGLLRRSCLRKKQPLQWRESPLRETRRGTPSNKKPCTPSKWCSNWIRSTRRDVPQRFMAIDQSIKQSNAKLDTFLWWASPRAAAINQLDTFLINQFE